jgi:hypothetical protein
MKSEEGSTSTTAPFTAASKNPAAMLVRGRRYISLTAVLTRRAIRASGADGIDKLPSRPVTINSNDSDAGEWSLLTPCPKRASRLWNNRRVAVWRNSRYYSANRNIDDMAMRQVSPGYDTIVQHLNDWEAAIRPKAMKPCQ